MSEKKDTKQAKEITNKQSLKMLNNSKFGQNAHRAIIKDRDTAAVFTPKVSDKIMKSILSDYRIPARNVNASVKKKEAPAKRVPISVVPNNGKSLIDFICEADGDSYISDTNGIIVTMTSWVKRINNVEKTLKTILGNTEIPEKIIINLTTEEFPNKENSLPSGLVNLAKMNSIIEFHWLKHNTTVWKKIIPTLIRFKNANIICIDDDRLYPKDFIATFKNALSKYPSGPITGANISFYKKYKQHCGHATLDKYAFYKDGLDFITKEVMDLKSSDSVLTVIANRTGHPTQYLGVNYLSKIPQNNNPVDGYSSNGNVSVSAAIKQADALFDKYSPDVEKTHMSQVIVKSMPTVGKTVGKNDKIIVTLTSYKKRINTIKDVIISILKNTLKADKVVLNLAEDEFPKKENELPLSLVDLVRSNPACEINWVKENVRQFKKLIPTLERYPNDVIISVDDDIIYGEKFLQTLYTEYIRWGKQCPITIGGYLWPNNLYSHCGAGTLVTSEMFGDCLYDIYYNFAKKVVLENKIKVFDDPMCTYAMLLNGRRYKYVRTVLKTIPKEDSITHAGNKTYRENIFHWHDLIKGYIKNKYGKTYEDMLKAPIILNFTTWKKRENVVPDMLKTIREQSLKPDKVVVYLSETEYGHTIPDVIKRMKETGYITDIEWVPGNIYSHKRWEAFKKYNNCYNVFVDDDIYYDKNYVKDLVETAIQNQGCDIIWTSQIEEIQGVKRSHPKDSTDIKSKKLQTLSGMSCFPPFTFPIESYEHSAKRDKWCTKCDDSWNRAWIIKNGIDIVRVHDRHKTPWKGIPNTENDGIWKENKKIINGVETMMTRFANALICANATAEAKAIWPQFDINKCCSKELNNSVRK